jgi:hypothetical protein
MDSTLMPEHAAERSESCAAASCRHPPGAGIYWIPAVSSLADGLKTLMAWWHDEQAPRSDECGDVDDGFTPDSITRLL